MSDASALGRAPGRSPVSPKSPAWWEKSELSSMSDASALAPFVALTIGVDLCMMHAVEVAAHLSGAHRASRMDVRRVAVSALTGLLLMYAGALARLCDQRRVAACSVLMGCAYCLPLAGDVVRACVSPAVFGRKEE